MATNENDAHLNAQMNAQIRAAAGKRPSGPARNRQGQFAGNEDGSTGTVKEFAAKAGARNPDAVAKLIQGQNISLEEATKRLRNEHSEMFYPVGHQPTGNQAMNDSIRRMAGKL